MREYLRNLKDTRIVITLENIANDVLIHTDRQRPAAGIDYIRYLREDRILFETGQFNDY